MENSSYNSLTEKLIQNGIIPYDKNDEDNIFQKQYDTIPDAVSSPLFYQPDIKQEENKINPENKKRINEYDLELIKGKNPKKITVEYSKKNALDFLLFKFFPKIYRARLVKKAMKRLLELNIDADNLFNKTIPYGENEIRYKELVEYLKYVSELQLKLDDGC